MLYSAFITKLRRELKDFPKTDKFLVGDKWSGDGTNKYFFSTFTPIMAASYTVLVGGVAKTETTHYTLDKDTGFLSFGTAPIAGTDNVELRYKYYKIKDADYIEIINDGIEHFKWKLWDIANDTSTITTTADEYEIDLSSLTGILYVLNAWYKSSSSATVWQALSSLTNWKYYPRTQELYVDPTFSTSDLPMKFLYLKAFTKGTAVGSTLAVPDEYITPFKYYCYAKFYERLIPEKVGETVAVTTLPSYTPGQVMLNIAEYYYKKAEEEAAKIAPKLPPMAIKQSQLGIAV